MTYNEKLDHSLQLSINGQFDEAEKILNSLHTEQPNDPRVIFNLGWYDCRKGNFLQGIQKMSAGRHLNVFGNRHIGTLKPIWNGQESLDFKTILFNCEGGLGDQIISFRFIPIIKKRFPSCKIIVACDPSLFCLIDNLITIHHLVSNSNPAIVNHDYWIPAMSAIEILGTNEIPSSNCLQKPLSNNYNKKFKIGIRWSGNPEFEHEQHRRFDPNLMINMLLQLKESYDIEVYSFQRDENCIMLPSDFIDLKDDLKTWSDTAQHLSNMDFVISSCTSLAHLSATLQRPTWIIVPVLPYYIWADVTNNIQNEDDEEIYCYNTPWYKTATIFRQKNYGEWENVFWKIHSEYRLRKIFLEKL